MTHALRCDEATVHAERGVVVVVDTVHHAGIHRDAVAASRIPVFRPSSGNFSI